MRFALAVLLLASQTPEYLKVPTRVGGNLTGTVIAVYVYNNTEYDSYKLMFNNGSRTRDITENKTEELTFKLGLGWHVFRLELYRGGKMKKVVKKEVLVR